MNGDTTDNRIDALLEAANDAAKNARNTFLFFLLAGAYVFVIVSATTDELLFRGSTIELPGLDVRIPIVGFYIFAPILLLVFHFNLLLQFYLLANTLHTADQALEGRADHLEHRVRLYPFPFSHMLIGDQHNALVRLLMGLLVSR